MSETTTVEWDSAGDGTFSTDITAYVMDIRTDRGRKTDLGKMPAGTAMLVLNNHDGRFSPDKADGPYYGLLEMYRRIRIKGTVVGASTYGMFYGFLLDWDNKPKITQQTVTWYLGDRFALWQHTMLNLPLLRKLPIRCALDLAMSRAMGDNQCANPSAEDDLTGYSGLQGITPVRDPSMKIEGDYTVLCDCPGANAGEGWRFTATGSVTAGKPIMARVWVKASKTVLLTFRAFDTAERGIQTLNVGTTPTLLEFTWAAGFQGANHYFELYTQNATEAMFWSGGLYFVTLESTGCYSWRNLDAGTAEIELATSYRQPALETLQAIAESEPRSFFFSQYDNTYYLEHLRFYDKDYRDTAIATGPLASFRDNSLATTNYVKDPSFEHDTIGDHWAVDGIDFRVTSNPLYGSHCLRKYDEGPLAEGTYHTRSALADAPAASEDEVWTASAYFRLTSLTNIDILRVTVEFLNGDDAYVGSASSSNLLVTSSDYVRLEATGTAPATTAKARVVLELHVKTGGGGMINCRIDGVQLEEKSAATRYCDGDQPGGVWAGTAHESTSSRGAAIPYFDLIYGEHAIDRVSECELTSQGDFEDENVSATIWELSPTGYLIPATESITIHAQYSQPARDCSLEVPIPPTAFVIAQESDDANLLKLDEGAPSETSSLLQVGMMETGNTYRYRSYLRFNTAVIPDGATITAAKIVLVLKNNYSTTDFDINVRDAPGWHPISSDDWTKGDGEDLLGSLNTAALPPAGQKVEIEIDDLTGIDKTGWTEFRLASSRDEDGENPILNVLELVIFQYYGAGEAVRPRLEVTYTGAAFASATMENYGVGAKIVLTAGAIDAIVPDISITGVPLRGSSEESKVVAASASPPAIERTLPYSLPLQGTRTSSMETEASRLADRYDGRIRRCSLVLRPKTDAILTQMLSRELSELIHIENISEDFSSHLDANCWIEGIEHHIVPGIWHETIFHLEEE